MDFSITLAGKQTVLTTGAFKWDSPDPPLSADHLFFSAHTPPSFRFTSAGLCCVAHLRSLAIEDYTLLGICSAEESSRLSKLIRNVNFERVPLCGQSDYEDYIDEGYFPLFDDNDGQVCTASILNPLFLFFSTKSTALHKNQHVPAFPEFDGQREKLAARNGKSGMEIICAHSSNVCRSPNGSSASESKSGPKRVTTQMFSGKLARQRDRKGTSRKQKLHTKMNNRMDNKRIAMKVPIYELKTTVSYNYGLPLSSLPSPENKWV